MESVLLIVLFFLLCNSLQFAAGSVCRDLDMSFCLDVIKYRTAQTDGGKSLDATAQNWYEYYFMNWVPSFRKDNEDCKKALKEYFCTYFVRRCVSDSDTSQLPCKRQCDNVVTKCDFSTGITGCAATDENCSCVDGFCPHFDWTPFIVASLIGGIIILIVVGINLAILCSLIVPFGAIFCISITSYLLKKFFSKNKERPVQIQFSPPSLDLKIGSAEELRLRSLTSNAATQETQFVPFSPPPINTPTSSQVQFEFNAMEIKISDLTIIERLGKGSYGVVFKAVYRQSNVAVKIIEEESENFADCLRETITMAQLQHPRLLHFYGVLKDQGKLGIVTEFMERGSLDKLLWRKGRTISLTWADKITILGDVSSGMSFIHSRGFIHRDLKSPNVLIGESNRAKIGDFGIARAVDKSDSTMSLVGTPLWLAPEIIESTGHYDNKCDVFSFGIIMWELLTEKEPYYDITNKHSVMFNVVRDPNFRPTVPSVDTVMNIHSSEEERKSIDSMFLTFVSLMRECWNQNPTARPTFDQVSSQLNILNKAL